MWKFLKVRGHAAGGDMLECGSSASSGAGARRPRALRLVRPRRALRFGFSLRGGREHAAGFFVSAVHPNSEAYNQGLKVGDQLISVNGYRVDDAVHAELVHYIAAQTSLKVKVRSVGMVPVKERSNDALSWKFVSDSSSLSSEPPASHSPPVGRDGERLAEMRLSLFVPPKAKLGCGICKGPDWKPGIYVQFVKDPGIAHDAGLRAGDQILSCNGIDFTDIQFSDAVSVMKASARLDVVARAGAGAELVSPESSGYSSSASSAAGGEASPPAGQPKRLSIVTEETADLGDRLTYLETARMKRRTWENIEFDWKTGSHKEAPSDIEPDYDTDSIAGETTFVTSPQNKTVINLTEHGATIECSCEAPRALNTSGLPEANKKTIVVEVHKNEGPPEPPHPAGKAEGEAGREGFQFNSNTYSDTVSLASVSTLSSAITDEIMRRKQKTKEANYLPRMHEPPPLKASVLSALDNEKKRQHDALMDEFKKVHRKMFSAPNHGEDAHDQRLEDRHTNTLKEPQSAPTAEAAPHPPAPAPPPAADKPPPPPPMPPSEKGIKSIPSTQKSNGIAKNVVKLNENNNVIRPTTIPQPDYDMNRLEKLTRDIKLTRNSKDDTAEMESIDSYKLKNPASPKPCPPSTYFMKPPTGSATMKKIGRPVSVTIGEYPSQNLRKQPSKLDFLNGDTKTPTEQVDAPIGSRFQSELTQTLTRSNLKKRNEANIINESTIKSAETPVENNKETTSDNHNFHKRYGNNIQPLPPLITIPKVPVLKSIPKGFNNKSTTTIFNGNKDHNDSTEKIENDT